MSNNSSNEKMAALAAVEKINEIEGFDPKQFAVEYEDADGDGSHTRLPVMAQMAWFRLKYPEGKIAVKVTPGKDCFIATARVYPNYKDPVECYLAEATASRKYDLSKPSISPREWAQTAAVGIALRNAGFGLQFDRAGDDISDTAPDELGLGDYSESDGVAEAEIETAIKSAENSAKTGAELGESEETVPQPELTYEEKLRLAMATPCPISKYKGKTLGEVASIDPKALNWVVTKFSGDESIRNAAKLICEYALEQQQATA